MKRRGFLIGLGSLLTAPAIMRATSLMPVSVAANPWQTFTWGADEMLRRLAASDEPGRWATIDLPPTWVEGIPGTRMTGGWVPGGRSLVRATPVPEGWSMRASPPIQRHGWDYGYAAEEAYAQRAAVA